MPPEAAAGEAAAPALAPSIEPVTGAPAEVGDEGWTRALVVAGGRIPEGVGRRKVVVAQSKGKVSGYPTGGHLYYRTSADVQFPADADVLTLGENVRASGVGGFTVNGGLRQGPGLPAYAAANAAYQRGARDIQISGLTKAEQERMQPWLDSPKMPADLSITFV